MVIVGDYDLPLIPQHQREEDEFLVDRELNGVCGDMRVEWHVKQFIQIRTECMKEHWTKAEVVR